MQEPLFAHALSTLADPDAALDEALAQLEEQLGERRPDLLAVFLTHHHGPLFEGLGTRVIAATGARALVGCTGEGILGAGREVEHQPALCLWAACLPGTRVGVTHISASSNPDGTVRFQGMDPSTGTLRSSLLLLADPFTFPTEAFLAATETSHPGLPIVGGMASGGQGPGQNLLFEGTHLRAHGALAIILEGDVQVRSIVSQGTRPVGKPYVITAAKGQYLEKLGGRPALEVLMETLTDLEEPDRELFRAAPFVGLAVDASQERFERGDFLVRGLMGVQPDAQHLVVGSELRAGRTLQFLVRDAASAGDDLTELMASRGPGRDTGSTDSPTIGALLFTCNGRGTQMFAEPDHDITRVVESLPPGSPVAGFFAMGELGPIGSKNYLHAFTASVAVFHRRQASPDAEH